VQRLGRARGSPLDVRGSRLPPPPLPQPLRGRRGVHAGVRGHDVCPPVAVCPAPPGLGSARAFYARRHT